MNYQFLYTFLVFVFTGYLMLMFEAKNIFFNATAVIFFVGGILGALESLLFIIW